MAVNMIWNKLYASCFNPGTMAPPLPPLNIHSQNHLLQTATHQKNLSWYNFLCGFMARGWRAVQYEHLLHIGSQRASVLWMAKLQWKIWEIVWSLWLHRNNHLHNDSSSIHRTNYQSVVSKILRERNIGLNMLPSRYQHIFQDSVQQHLNKNIHLN